MRVSFEKVSEVRQQVDEAFPTFLLAVIGALVDRPDFGLSGISHDRVARRAGLCQTLRDGAPSPYFRVLDILDGLPGPFYGTPDTEA